jgi:predicted PurR-regulated permease PerM
MEDINEMLAHFIRAQLLLAALSALIYMAGLWLMQVPYALALGSIAGVMEFVPIVGPLVGAIAILGVAFLADYRRLLLAVIFLGIWRVAQDYVVSPRIMGRKIEIHPLAAILGVYLSVPLMASLRILWRRWHAYSEASIKGGIISPYLPRPLSISRHFKKFHLTAGSKRKGRESTGNSHPPLRCSFCLIIYG